MSLETLPAAWYHGDDAFERERRAIFGREWLPVGFALRLAEPGEYLTADIAGTPILVLRDDDGMLRGFHNVCRHRAGPLVQGTGSAGALVCRYHAWTYDLSGKLVRARDFGEDVEPSEHSLFPIRVGEWRGVIFVSQSSEAPALLDAMASFDSVCPPFDIAALPETRELHADMRANWKTYADNYLEGYHIPIVHPRLAKEIDTQRYTVETGDGWVRHTAPPRDSRATSGVWLWRYPNLAVNVYPEGVNIEWYMPLSPGQTRVKNHYFFAEPGSPGNEEAMALSAEVLNEDCEIVAAVQRNLEAGIYTAGPLSPKHEAGVAAFQAWVRAAVARDGT